jgi:hypothetical protein
VAQLVNVECVLGLAEFAAGGAVVARGGQVVHLLN